MPSQFFRRDLAPCLSPWNREHRENWIMNRARPVTSRHSSITSWDRHKSAPHLRLKKRKVFKICPTRFYEKLRKVSKHRKGAFCARKTLQKFRCSVLRQMSVFSILRLLLGKTQITSDTTIKVRILRNIFEPPTSKIGYY